MMKHLSNSILLAAGAAVMLSACGGGGMVPVSAAAQPPASSLSFSNAPASSEPIIRSPARLAAQAQPGMGSINADDFMTWVQQTLPAAFPGPQSSVSAVANGISYNYRYYPLVNGGWNIVAVTADAKVYAIGDITHGALVQFGVLSDYLCGVNPGRCVASTYAVGSIEAKRFAELNDARIKGGFGALAQDVNLDKGAFNHAAYYEAQYYKPYYHTTDNQTLPYTGVEPLNPAFADPIIYFYDAVASSEVDPATGWLKGHVETPGQPGFTGILPVNRANAAGYAGGTAQYAGEVIGGESPTSTLTVTSFTMTGPGNTGVPVKLLMTKDFPGYIGRHQAYIVPNGALAPSSTYTVTFVGTDNGIALAKTWSFTTAPLVCDQFGCR